MKYVSLSRGALCAFAYCLLILTPVMAGVTNPDLSVIGQMRSFMTDDPEDINRNRGQISFDESEIVADAYLNPFSRGTFVFAVADGEMEVEEGYLQIFRGLPSGLAIKAGKYRVGFGKLNPIHPHAYPFIDGFRMLEAYLPGEESFNETGGQLSYRLPLPGDISSILSADVLQGGTFHPDEEESRPAVLVRWSNFFLLKDPSALEIGLSFAQGTNNAAMKTTTILYGLDIKAKLWQNQRNYLIVQSEVIGMDREDALVNEDSSITRSDLRPSGAYIFADYTMRKRYNAGLKYEQFQRPELSEEGKKLWDKSFGVFTGVALMEETTLFRLAWDRFEPEDGDAFNTFTLQCVFSMGPHKAHQF